MSKSGMKTKGLEGLTSLKDLDAPDLFTGTLRDADRAFIDAMRVRRIPERSGRLKNSLIRQDHKDHIARRNGARIEVGSSVPYAEKNLKRIKDLTDRERERIFVEPLASEITRKLGGE